MKEEEGMREVGAAVLSRAAMRGALLAAIWD